MQEAEHLVPSAVREQRPVPMHERVQPAGAVDHLGAGAQREVEGVGQNDVGTGARDLLRGERADGPVGADRHKDRSLHGPVRRVQQPRPGAGLAIDMDDLEANGHGSEYTTHAEGRGSGRPKGDGSMHRADPPSPQRAPGPSPHDAFNPRLILAGILAVAAILRFAMLGAPSFSYDEIVVATMARARWYDILPTLRAGEFHPPLYYLLMKAWAEIAGVGETAFRFPSACFGLASVGLTYTVARRVSSEPVRLLSALFVAVSPFQIMVSQEDRLYVLLGALVLASTLALTASVERDRPILWAGYVLASALMVYTQYIGALVL